MRPRTASGRRSSQSLALGALGLLVALVAVLAGWQVVDSHSIQGAEIENGEVTAARLAARALGNTLASRVQLLTNLASQPAVSKLFTSFTASERQQAASELHLLYPDFASFELLDGAGRLIGDWPARSQALGTDLASSEIYRGVLASGRPYVGTIEAGLAGEHRRVVGLAAPVEEAHGRLLGILQATLSSSTLSAIFGGTRIAGGGSIVILDRHGDALSGPGAGALTYLAEPLVARALSGRSGAATGSVPGFAGTRLVGYAAVPSPHWAVLVELPLSALNGPIAALGGRLAAIGALVLVIAAATAVFVGRLLRRLAHERERSEAVLASVGEGVTTLDLGGRPLRVNPALERLIGVSAQRLVGRPWGEAFQLFSADGRRLTWQQSNAARAIAERRVVATTGYGDQLGRGDGTRLPVSVTAAPLFVGGELTGAVVVLRDVSHEREVDELKTSLVSTVSHELRTPLTMIQGFSELLLDRDLGPERSREALQQVHTSAQRLSRLIDDLLSVSRIDSGKLEVESAALDLDTVIADVVTGFGDDASRLVVEVGPRLPSVLADRDKVVQILTNLVSNALKYSSAPSPVELAVHQSGPEVVVTVTDYGIGISEEEQTRIFERFGRIDRPEVRQAGGTGLGLYITKNLVEMQGGRLRVRSERGVGSAFSFTLPLSRDHARERLEEQQLSTASEA